MPSFGDGHAHPMLGGLEFVGPAVRPCTSVDEIVEAVRAYARRHPDEEWIIGASYDGSLAPEGLFDARWLDEAVSDRPVVLRAWDYHTVWCNSVALERAGIDPDTPDPALGEIPHRDDGSVLGTLREWGAVDLVLNRNARRAIANVGVTALRTAADYYLARGVTWVQDAWVNPDDVDIYLEAARRDALRHSLQPGVLRRSALLRFAGEHIRRDATPRRRRGLAAADRQHGQVLRRRRRRERDRRAAGAVLLGPAQTTACRCGRATRLAEAARRVDELGLQIHIHAIGDAAVRQALDAIEHAIVEQRTARPPAGDRPRPTGRRRRPRPVRASSA